MSPSSGPAAPMAPVTPPDPLPNATPWPEAHPPTEAGEIDSLRERVHRLEQEKSDLEISLATACEHGDAVEADLHAANTQLRLEIRDRMIAEWRLARLVQALKRQTTDLELLVETITEHSDAIDTTWLKRYSDLETVIDTVNFHSDVLDHQWRQKFAEVEILARRDPLTGIANRREFDSILDREWARAQRQGLSLALMICDLDHFKQYNDRYGHSRGDAVLITFARLLQGTCRRPADLAARIGGEEFIALLPETDLDNATALANDLINRLFAQALPHEDSPLGRVTVSIGVAVVDTPLFHAPTDLIDCADRLLYDAKNANRNTLRASHL